MLLRHETTPGYATLARRRRTHRRVSERIASAVVAVALVGGFAFAAVTQPGLPTTFALGIGLVLYVLASFGLEDPPKKAPRSARPRVHREITPRPRPADEFDWERLDEPATT